MQTILNGFLSSNLLPIGEDDEKLKLLEEAAIELAKEINAKPLVAYRCALVGLDEKVSAADPVHKIVGETILAKWQTMINKTGASPVQVHRAVMLRAIELAAAEQPALRFAMTLIARNQPAGATEGKARDAIAAMLAAWDASVAEELNAAWLNPVDMSLPKLSAKLKKPAISKEEVTAAVSRAAGPQDRENKPQANANPHWPNSGQPWSNEFVPRAADAIYTAIQAGAKGYAEDMQETLREIVQGWGASLERLTMRDAKAELLWIRTSMYSPSARTGYRTLSPTDLVLHAVLDTSRTVTEQAPPSVEFFLRDLVAGLAPKRTRLAELLNAVGPKLAALPEGQAIAAADSLPAQGRRSWLDFAVRGAGTGAFEEQTGVPGEFEDQPAEFAVRFYRELQIRKLLTSKT